MSTQFCDNCGTVLKGKWDVHKFTSRLKETEILVGDAVSEFLKRETRNQDIGPTCCAFFSHRCICQVCMLKLKSWHKARNAFMPSPGTQSYIRGKIDENLVVKTNSSIETMVSPSDFNQYRSDDHPIRRPATKKLKKNILKQQKKFSIIRPMQLKMLSREVKSFASNSVQLHGNIKRANSIPVWSKVDAEMITMAPNLRQVLLSVGGKNVTEITPKIGAALAILLNAVNQNANRFQSCISFTLARTRASREIYKTMNKLGISTSYDTLIRNMDVVNKTYDEKVHHFRTAIMEKLSSELPDEQFNTFSLCFDNLNRRIVPSQTSTKRQVKELSIVSVLAFKNRVPFQPGLSATECRASDVPVSAFELTADDVKILQNSFKQQITEFLVEYMAVFQGINLKRSTHKNSNYVSQKTEIVNLGAIHENESTIDGTLSILRNLKKFAVKEPNGKKFPIIIYGDGLTNRRTFEARSHAAATPISDSKCDDFREGVGFWHGEVIQASLDMKMFFKDGVTTSRGTLPQLRDRFKFSRVFKNTKECFNATKRFYRFATASYVLALACKHIGLTSVNEEKPYLTPELKVALLEETVHKILQFSWHSVERSAVQTRFCYCQRTMEESDALGLNFVGCDFLECKNLWYHKECLLRRQQSGVRVDRSDDNSRMSDAEQLTLAGRTHDEINPDEVEVDWEEVDEDDDDIAVEFEDDGEAEIDEDLIFQSKKTGTWYCCSDCKKKDQDGVIRYSRGLMFTGLMQECFRDAIRKGDGDRIVAHMKTHLMRFTYRRHPTYRGVTARYLAAVAGAAPLHVQHDLKFNSFINVLGKESHNLPCDLVNEFINKVFSQFLSAGLGTLSTATIERKTRCIGFLLEFATMVRTELCRDKQIGRTPKDTEAWKVDLNDCVELLLAENLFDISDDPRHHDGFKTLQLDELYAADILKYRDAIKPIITRMDNLTEVETAVNN